jgi:aerobic carbon-monoxide dehydrogenase small subunit
MISVQLNVNGRSFSEAIEPRTHLADLLRERLNLTATHLRCEQGACGACTLLIDGQPARSCITYAAICDGADITTLEGLEDDAVIAALRRSFSQEHALQCGYCTPGMLMTARDIILRLPDADSARIRAELSGNLCRCTGYVGIVRAVSRVLDERRRGELRPTVPPPSALGPVGARPAKPTAEPRIFAPEAPTQTDVATGGSFGLGASRPNVEIRQSFTVSRPAEEVWGFLRNPIEVVHCVPGAKLASPPSGDIVEGSMVVKVGPITADFAGQARIARDDMTRRGVIMGSSRDRAGGSRARGEVEYVVESLEDGGARVVLTIRALLLGPLAQFGRATILGDVVDQLARRFAHNLEARLADVSAADDRSSGAPLRSGSLLVGIAMARLKRMLDRIFGPGKP